MALTGADAASVVRADAAAALAAIRRPGTALAIWRDERRSAAGALAPRSALSAIATRTSRGPPAVCTEGSTRPALAGTNSSGPRSPTR